VGEKKMIKTLKKLQNTKSAKGFTLIELMITLLIVAVLATYATTSYKTQMMKSRRTEAKNKLYEIMQREEKYMSENNTYTTTLTGLGYAANPVITDNGYYSIAAAANANGINDGVILTATPKLVQVGDTTCMNMILNSNGAKTTSTGATTGCW
jgi:type IV pilus assembly protein PilE